MANLKSISFNEKQSDIKKYTAGAGIAISEDGIISATTGLEIKSVDVLPNTGVGNTIYLIPSDKPGEKDISLEYLWINDAWELIGSTKVDLTDINSRLDTLQGDVEALNGVEAKLDSLLEVTGNIANGTENDVFITNAEGKAAWSKNLNIDTLTVAGVDMTTLVDRIKALEGTVNKLIPAVGDIEINTTGTNPSTKYPGTTWAAWGSGRVPVGVDTAQTEFAKAEQQGGEKTHALSVAELAAHNHGMGHTHTMAHTHSMAHTHNSSKGKFLEMAAATALHIFLGKTDASSAHRTPNLLVNEGDDSWYTSTATAGASAANTGNSSAANTGNSSAANTSNNGSGTAHNNLQPYITCYMWKRTA